VLVIVSRHHGDKHINVLSLADLLQQIQALCSIDVAEAVG
jgi:hypothetical protein